MTGCANIVIISNTLPLWCGAAGILSVGQLNAAHLEPKDGGDKQLTIKMGCAPITTWPPFATDSSF